jgi:hypothetical protein
MFKRALLLVLIFIPLWLSAQDMPFSVRSRTKYSISGMVGYEEVDSVKYYQLRLIQEFKIWKFGMGLDLDFLLDKNMHLKKSDWDQIKDVLTKIYYFRYAEKGDPFYVQVGGFPNYTIGNGLVMLNYSNMLLYPDLRNTGLLMGSSPYWPLNPSFEIFSSDVQRNQILSLTAHCKPVPDSTVKIFGGLIAGFSAAIDRNQKSNLKYVVVDSLYDSIHQGKSNSVAVFSADYTLPLIEKENVTFGQYAEIAHIAGYGAGVILPGMYGDFKFLKVSLEYRIYGREFLPAFFDHYYEESRASYLGSLVITKEQTLKSVKASQGWYGRVQGFVGRKLKVMVAWQDMYGKGLTTGKSVWLKLWVDTQYKRLENISLAYSKTNRNEIFSKNLIVPNANFDFKMTFSLNDKRRWFLVGKYAEDYKDRNGDGKTDWVKETKRSGAIGLKYTF